MSEYVVELKHITKRFPGVVALKDMSIGIRPGEIHGLIGENGAGKSTLIKVLTGVHTPEEGEIFVDGQKVVFKNPVQSREAGIACVYQELNIVKQLPVTDNVFMGRAVKKGLLLDYPRMHAEAEEALKTLGHPEINVHMECGKLGVGQQQMVEIAKAVSLDAKLIIMDEPTSSLGKEEIEQLMETVRGLKAKGVAILFVSHKLEELFELCDRVTVMRDGEHIITEDTVNLTEDSLINAMVGRTLDNLYPKEFGTKGEVWLEAKGLNEAGVLHDVSFKAHAGQITGFAGLVGAGRTETMRAVFGADKLDSGEIYVKGEKVHIRTPKAAPAADDAEYTDVKFSGVRKATAKGMMKSLSTMAQLTHYHSFDASALLALRKQIKANGETMGMPNITLNDMVLFAVSRILLHHPDLNATMPQENMLRQYHHVHLGMAVDTPKGLFVPTIFNADQMSLAEISTEAKRLAKLCQEGKATPDMLSGATFTVSNVGSLGVEMFTPIVNPPQVGILGVCGTTTRIKEVGGEIKPYQAMGLCLTYDHRAIDGSPASRFVKELCGALENFSLLMMK